MDRRVDAVVQPFQSAQGSAWRLPAGSHIVAESVYGGGKTNVAAGTSDCSSRMRLRANRLRTWLWRRKGDVPAGASSQKFRAGTRLAAETQTHWHSAWRASREYNPLKSRHVSRMGRRKSCCLRRIFAWSGQHRIFSKAPVVLPRGAEVFVTAYYANSGAAPQPGGIRVTVAVRNYMYRWRSCRRRF